MNLGAMKVTLLNVRVAGMPTFMPGSEPKRHHTMLTVICNRGINPTNKQEMSDAVTCNFWGKYAGVAAQFLSTGREISIDGELRSHNHETGEVKNGKRVIERRVEILVNRFYFGKDSMKELSARVNAKIAEFKQLGRLPATAQITAEELLAVTRPAAVDYNPLLAEQTGMYGNARVWVKGRGFLNNGLITDPAVAAATAAAAAAAGTVVTPVATPGAVDPNLVAQLTQLLAAQTAAATAAGTAVAGAANETSPFVPAT